jgi:predicted permease
MSTIHSDLRFALRSLRRQPAFTAAAVATLALAIGANAAMFTVVDAVFLRPVPAEDPASLVSVYRTFESPSGTSDGSGAAFPASYLNYLDFAERARTLAGLAAEAQGPISLSGGGEPERVTAGFVTANYFDVLGLAPVRGRFFLPDENRRGAGERVVVLGEGLWRRRFGGRDDVVGSAVPLNGRDFVVVGVAPAGFRGLFTLSNEALWVPTETWPALVTGPFAVALEHRGFRMFQMIGRLAPGQDRHAAQADLATIARRLAEEHPEWNRDRGVRVLGLAEGALNPNQRGAFVRAGAVGMGAVALVLLIACANVANLLIARGRARRREIAIRMSLGAGRDRVARQLLTEGLVLAGAGGIAGVLVATWALPALWRLRPPFLQDGHLDLGLDLRMLAFTAAVCVLAGVFFSLAPLFDATRPDLVRAVRGGGPSAPSRERAFGARHVLVAAQVALAVVLLVGAALFLGSLSAAWDIETGIEAERLAVLGLDVAALGLEPGATSTTLDAIVAEAAATPGIESAVLASVPPLSFGSQLRLMPEGSEESAPEGTYVAVNDVGDAYFETLGIALLEGRPLDATDRAGGQRAVVVNRTFAEQFWPGGSALGRRIRWPADDQPWIVVGVAEDVKYGTLGEEPQPYLYRALEQFPSPAVTLHLRGESPEELIAEVSARLRRARPDLPIVDPLTVRGVIDRSLWAGTLGATLLLVFGGLALVLAATGVYGVVSQVALARRREVGIRVALGARRSGVVSLIVRQGMAPVLAGALLGAVLCAPLSRLFAGLLYGGTGVSPSAVLGATAVLAATALVACAAPALRAARLDPVATLRAE